MTVASISGTNSPMTLLPLLMGTPATQTLSLIATRLSFSKPLGAPCMSHFQYLENVDTVESRYLEVVWTIFYKFKLPEVQINLHFG